MLPKWKHDERDHTRDPEKLPKGGGTSGRENVPRAYRRIVESVESNTVLRSGSGRPEDGGFFNSKLDYGELKTSGEGPTPNVFVL